ncbi:hypothetical protein D9M69_471180 [compost metagenome]
MQAIGVLTIELLPLCIVQRHRVQRFHRIVSVDVAPGDCGTGQVIVTELADVGRRRQPALLFHR